MFIQIQTFGIKNYDYNYSIKIVWLQDELYISNLIPCVSGWKYTYEQ